MHILIAENNWDGHRLHFVKLLISSALESGNSVSLVLNAEIRAQVEYLQQLASFEPKISIIDTENISLKLLRNISKKLNPDLVLIPDSDAFLIPLFIGRGWKANGELNLLVMRETAESKTGSRLLSIMKTWAKQMVISVVAKFKSIKIIVLKPATWYGHSKYSFARDPIVISSTKEDIAALAEEAKLSSEIFWVGIVGRNDRSKNPKLIAESIASLNDPSIGLALLGKLTEEMLPTVKEIRQILENSGNPFVIIPRVLSDSEFDAALQIVDCNVIVRTVVAPSAVVGKCIALGQKALVVGNEKEIDAVQVRKFPSHFVAVKPQKYLIAKGIKQIRESKTNLQTIEFAVKDFTDPLLTL